MKLICLTGIDGSGKTTLAASLTRELNLRGVRATSIYGRTYPVLSRGLMAIGRAALLRNVDPGHDYERYTAHKKRRMQNRALALGYSAAILVDYYVQLWLKLLPHLFSSHVVVCDRYVYDTVISDLAVHLDYSSAAAQRAVEIALSLAPLPALTVLLDLPAEVAFRRKDDVPDIAYLYERQGFYRELRERREVVLMDGQEQTDRLVESILESLTPAVEGFAKDIIR